MVSAHNSGSDAPFRDLVKKYARTEEMFPFARRSGTRGRRQELLTAEDRADWIGRRGDDARRPALSGFSTEHGISCQIKAFNYFALPMATEI